VAAMLTSLFALSEHPFQAGPAESYSHQGASDVTVGAKAYDTPELVGEAFGKVALLQHGVLPVLVVLENKGKKSLDLEVIEVNLVASDGRHATAISPDDVPFLGTSAKRPNNVPLPIRLPKKKNSLSSPDIAARAFSAKMLPPGETASGFFYFEARSEVGDKLYLNGLRDARSRQELMYFEFPLQK